MRADLDSTGHRRLHHNCGEQGRKSAQCGKVQGKGEQKNCCMDSRREKKKRGIKSGARAWEGSWLDLFARFRVVLPRGQWRRASGAASRSGRTLGHLPLGRVCERGVPGCFLLSPQTARSLRSNVQRKRFYAISRHIARRQLTAWAYRLMRHRNLTEWRLR